MPKFWICRRVGLSFAATATPDPPWNLKRVSIHSIFLGVRRRRWRNFGFTFIWRNWNVAAATPDPPWNFESVSDNSIFLGVRRRRWRNFAFAFIWKKLSDIFGNWRFRHKINFRRRRLPYHLVMRCRRRISHRPPTLHACSCPPRRSGNYTRWRRRRRRPTAQDHEDMWKRCAAEHQSFLSGEPPDFNLNLPFSEDTLEQFCHGKDSDGNYLRDFLGLMHLFKGFEEEDHSQTAQDTVNRMNGHRTAMLLQAGSDVQKLSKHFKHCPVVWDTGASYGLTPFRGDFIDYEECRIPVQDISKTNYVVGIGTVMWKFKTVEGKDIYLPLLCYHLETADIRLLSPQTYHQLHGGDSHLIGNGSAVAMEILSGPNSPSEQIVIPIEKQTTNLPVIYGVSCTDKERAEIGPQLRSSLAKHQLDFKGSWHQARVGLTRHRPDLNIHRHWNSDIEQFEFEYQAVKSMCCPCVGDDSNSNLTGPQRELLLWHWKLGVSMTRIQQLMVEHKAIDANKEEVIMPQVIKPTFKSTSSCPIPLCTACELARAKRRNPQVSEKKAIMEKQGILSANQYEPGDHVSMDQFVSQTTGRLPTGYGRERPENRYHGGTIFNDAATGIIWVENQISLGAGETIMSKHSFEQWLYELACVEVKRYHSDNGVFVADEFREDCKDKQQKQSFSGVGAKHQNARAERSIQTIMYMARTFMLHVALHWNENGTDNLALWPFAVKHAVWLYNRVPNRITGLTPLELLTRSKADHRDLLRSHVWGCPTFVLDARLQDGKKIPKWNRRARLGQFLGYSDEHSSLVANVRHLKTGHVSPQYHCVFDDLFQTVFSDGGDQRVIDAICNTLWENNREQYAEEEYDEDGMLVYQPPPLDKVWLTEPERRDRENRLRNQRSRQRRREKMIIDAIPADLNPTSTPDHESLPGIVSRSGSSSDSSTLGVVHESEGDMWADHPETPPSVVIQPEGAAISNETRNQNEPDLIADPEPPPVPDIEPSEGASPSPAPAEEPRRSRRLQDQQQPEPQQPPKWSRDSGGRLKRHDFASMSTQQFNQAKAHMSKKDRSIYYTSLNAKKPPKACRLSRKKMKARQRRRIKREIGDAMLNAMHFGDDIKDEKPVTVESILNSPLSKFIHLAANDCGYRGSEKELICNWIHPLFLKAISAASKEDNPNWWQAMSGPFADEYWKAAVTEIETLEAMGAWEVVDRTDDMNVIDSTWAFKLKRYPDGLIKKFKARFCARGDQQIEGVDFFETYAPVVQWTTVRLMLILEVLLDLKSKQGDVTAAFLHADIEEGEEVYVKMPRGFERPGKVLKLKKTLYGLRQSPRAFWKYMVEKMEACGCMQSELDPCLFVSEHVIAVMFVDDILFWSKDEKHIHDLAMQLREQGVDLEQEDDAAGFLGVRLEKNEETGMLEMKQTGLIDRIIEALGLDVGTVNGKATPAEHAPLVKDVDGPEARRDFSYSSVVGMLLYLSGHSRPDIAYAVNCSARYMFCPKKSHEDALKRIGRYLKATRDRGLVLNPTGDILKIDAYPDADFAGMYGHEKPTDPASVKSRTGYVITIASCAVLWQSKLQTETALSTMEAEIVALAHCCRELFPIMDMVAKLGPAVGLEVGQTTMNVSIHEDNAGALILAETLPPQYTPRSKHYAIKTVWFREAIVKRGIKLLKIATIEQLGDIFTKGLPKATFEYLRKKLMGW